MSQAFRDNTGREWSVEMTIGAAKRVKRTLDGVDLLALHEGEPPLLTRLDLDLELLVNVIYVLVKPQADAAGVSDEAFGEALGGEAILAAHDALMEALADFFRGLARTHLATAIQKQRALTARAMDVADGKLAEIDVEQTVQQAFQGGTPSPSSPPSSDSSPTP